jgi:hypothetical protein
MAQRYVGILLDIFRKLPAIYTLIWDVKKLKYGCPRITVRVDGKPSLVN